MSDLALLIVDEEQDSSYKQEEMPRYHARDVAVMRAKMANATVVLGSATPSLESYYNAKKHKYALIELPDRVGETTSPGSRDHRHAPGVSGNRAGASDLAQARRGNRRTSRKTRAGDDSPQPPRILSGRSVPHVRKET